MVIDDQLKVWEDRDQSRVHVVPAFAPHILIQYVTVILLNKLLKKSQPATGRTCKGFEVCSDVLRGPAK